MPNFKSKVRKYAKKQVRRAGVALKKRYVSKKGGLKYQQIARDVMRLKSLVNAEKKRTDLESSAYYFSGAVGQVQGTNAGHRILDISPSSIVQGNDYNQRNGNSIRLHSCVIKGQLRQQTSTNQAIRVAIDLFVRKTDIASLGSLDSELYSQTPFVTGGTQNIIDYNSVRNPDYFNDYYRIGGKRLVVRSDTISPQTPSLVNFTLPIRFRNLHAKWNKLGSYEQSQIIIVLRCDNGNCGTSVVSTHNNIASTGTNTGLNFSLQWQYFYYDN